MVYVLDTNVIIHYLKRDVGVGQNLRLAISEGHSLLVPRAVDYEVCRGLEMLNATKMAAVYRSMTSPAGQLQVVNMGEAVWEIAKQLYVSLRQKGFMVGEIDILIGAFCLQHGYTLVTSNTKDFVNMTGLPQVNWWAM